MFDELIGKTVILKVDEGNGVVEKHNLKLMKAEGSLITIEDINGKVRVINMSAPQNIELVEK